MDKAWVPKVGDAPQIARRSCSEKKVLHAILFGSKVMVPQKPRKAGKSLTEEYCRDYVLSELNNTYYNKARPTLSLNGINLLHDNAPALQSNLVLEPLPGENILTVLLALPTPRILHHVICFCPGRKFRFRSAFGSGVFHGLYNSSKEDSKHAFEQWTH